MTTPKMRLDPCLPWAGGFPYQLLARFGITPESTAREVLDASFEMTPEDLADPRVTSAWEALRVSRDRLLLDFFCMELPTEAPAAQPAAGPPPRLPMAFLQELAAAWPAALSETQELAFPPPALRPVLEGAWPLWDAGVAEPFEERGPA